MKTNKFHRYLASAALVVLLATMHPLSAETIQIDQQALKQCTMTLGRVDRLSCFDQLLGTPLEVLSAAEPQAEFIEKANAPAGPLEQQAKAMERMRRAGNSNWMFRFGKIGYPAVFEWEDIQEAKQREKTLKSREGVVPEKTQALSTREGQQPVVEPGATNVYLSMKALRSVDERQDQPSAILLLSCVEDITTVALVLDEPHAKRRVPIRVLLRDQRIDNDVWQSAESKRVLISPRGLTSIAHINRWAQVERVQFDVLSDDGSRAYLFDLANLREMLPPLRQACHW